MHVQLIAVPYDSARRGERMGAGPEALLEAGLVDRLRDAGHRADVQMIEASQEHWRAEIRTAFDLAYAVSRAVTVAISAGTFPLVLSGNCGPAALGCAAGLRDVRAVFWFDAHGDFNTPDTTIGGFLDGMALATLTGRCWPQLAAAIPGFAPMREDSVVLLGARDLDPLEAVALEASAIRRVRHEELRSRLPRALSEMRAGPGRAFVHLDLDVLDPSEGRINSYAAPGGFSQPDVEWSISTIAEAMPVGAASLTAFDPHSDPSGRALETALTLAVAVVDRVARP